MDKEQYIKVIDEYQDKISGSRKIKRFIHAAISGVDKDVINILGNKKCNNIYVVITDLMIKYDCIIYYNSTSTYLYAEINYQHFLFPIIDRDVIDCYNRIRRRQEYNLSTDNERIVNDYAISVCIMAGRTATNKEVVLVNKFTREILCYYLPGSEILFVAQDATKYFPEADCLVGKHILDNNLMKALIGTRIYNFIEPEMILCSLEGK